MILTLLVILYGILLISALSIKLSSASDNFSANIYNFVSSISNNNNDIRHEDRLQICCSWSTKLSDGILTYSIESEEEESREVIINAINEWDSKIDRLQLIEEQHDPSSPDIQIRFGKLRDEVTGNQYYDFKNKVNNDLTLIPSAGWTQFIFNKQGFIDGTKITISEDVLDQDFSEYIIEQIAKHELGHSLGLGHANYEGSLMADLVIEDKTATISQCEIDGFYAANSWKFINSKQNPEHPTRTFVSC
jgi:hypothetical protein